MMAAVNAVAGDAVWKGTVSGVWDGGALNWTVDGTPNQAFTNGDSATFDDSATIFTVTSGGTVSPSSVLVSNSANYTISAQIGGTGQVFKTGSGQLTLSGNNTYSGGTVIDGGARINYSVDANFGDVSGPLTLNGNGTVLPSSSTSLARPVVLNGNNNPIFIGGNGSLTLSGPVSGTGGLRLTGSCCGGQNFNLTSLSNTFTGELGFNASNRDGIPSGISSLADSPGAGNILWLPGTRANPMRWRSDAANSLVLNNRSIELRGDGDTTGMSLLNDNSSHAIIINTDLVVSGSGSKTFEFNAGAVGPTNAFTGDITDGTNGAAVAVTKTGSGSLLLSGLNTYSGVTTVSGGTLITEGKYALPEEGTLNLAGGKLVIDDRYEVVGALEFDGGAKATGTWGSTLSTAQNQDDGRFAGEGILYVGLPRPPKGTLIILK